MGDRIKTFMGTAFSLMGLIMVVTLVMGYQVAWWIFAPDEIKQRQYERCVLEETDALDLRRNQFLQECNEGREECYARIDYVFADIPTPEERCKRDVRGFPLFQLVIFVWIVFAIKSAFSTFKHS